MTDDEIIKALECCKDYSYPKICNECPYVECTTKKGCVDKMITDALAFINRQKAEIERLQGALTAEERHNELTMQMAQKAIQNAKADAIKEYLTMVLEKKDIAGHFEPRHGVVAVSVRDEYAKEFLGGQHGTD